MGPQSAVPILYWPLLWVWKQTPRWCNLVKSVTWEDTQGLHCNYISRKAQYIYYKEFYEALTGNSNAELANRIIRCIYAVLANKIMGFIYLECSRVYESFCKGFWILSVTVNIAQWYQMVVCLARRTRQLRLKLTINSPWETISGFNLTATRREKRPKVQPIFLLYSST